MSLRKSPCLGFQLLQYFVDQVQAICSRADSILLLEKARDLRAILAQNGTPDKELPRLVGASGNTWMRRWRKKYGISKLVTGMKLKVSMKKVKRRVRVFLSNLFRLRALWELHCREHWEGRDVPLHFLSLDQKPSWFNNAGHHGALSRKGRGAPIVKEDFNQTRQRYSILTAVPSEPPEDPETPPQVALLFNQGISGW